MFDMNEDKIQQSAERYLGKYREHIEFYESKSQVAQLGSVGAFDVYALGRQLELFEEYKNFCESKGSVADLGAIPSMALDVITASQSAAVLPLIASVQPIGEEQGIIYYKKVVATDTQGGFQAGETINHAFDGTQQKYSGSYGAGRQSVAVDQTVDSTTEYSGTLNVPVRPGTVEITVGTTAYRAVDRDGVLMGNGVYGTFNYENGTYELKFAENPGADHAISFNFDADVELQDNLPGIAGGMESTDIRAEVFALKAETGLLQEFSFAKRFGKMADDEVAKDLTNEVTRVLNTSGIQRLYSAAMGSTTWYKKPPSHISYTEHKLTFVDALAEAEAQLTVQAGRGTISRLIAGAVAATTLRTLPGFRAVEGGQNHQVGLYGYLDGVPVIRASKVMPDKEILCIYKGSGYFESPLVYAPYMPLFVGNTIPVSNNPMRSQRMACVWAGMKSVIRQYATRLIINDTDKNPLDA